MRMWVRTKDLFDYMAEGWEIVPDVPAREDGETYSLNILMEKENMYEEAEEKLERLRIRRQKVIWNVVFAVVGACITAAVLLWV